MSKAFTSPFAKSLYDSPSSNQGSPHDIQSRRELHTPATQFPSPLPRTPASAQQTPTGSWSHPAVERISQIQKKRAPNEGTLRRVILNFAGIVLLYKATPYITDLVLKIPVQVDQYLYYIIYALYGLLAYNVLEGVRRFFWTDTFEDYPLTPSQRKLLNLPASPVTAGASSITPPRYQKCFSPSPSVASPLARRASTSYSPTVKGTARASPLQSQSPNIRSVSMVDNGSSYSPQGSGKSMFSGSTRYKYQNVD